MRAVLVAMDRVFGQDRAQMPLTEDQDVVQALAAQRPDKPLRDRVSQARPEARSEVGNSLSGKTRPGTPGPTLIPKRIRHYGSNERIG